MKSRDVCKRLFDLIFATLLLVFCAPLLLGIAILVWVDSGSPVLFWQRRAGKGGKSFWLVKFRTMSGNSPYCNRPITSARDPRVTRIGRILRRLKLDELPQLWNVIRGEMSLVGPRPQTFELLPCYPSGDLEVILSVSPGITGPTQLLMRNEEELLAQVSDPMAYYMEVLLPQKIASDRAYVENSSFWLDLKILFRTVFVVFLPNFGGSTRSASVWSRGSLIGR